MTDTPTKLNEFLRISSKLVAMYLTLLFIKIVLNIDYTGENLVSNIFGTVFLAATMGGVIFLLFFVTKEPSPSASYRQMKVLSRVLAVLLIMTSVLLLLYGSSLVFLLQKDFLWGFLTIGAGLLTLLFSVLLLFSRRF